MHEPVLRGDGRRSRDDERGGDNDAGPETGHGLLEREGTLVAPRRDLGAAKRKEQVTIAGGVSASSVAENGLARDAAIMNNQPARVGVHFRPPRGRKGIADRERPAPHEKKREELPRRRGLQNLQALRRTEECRPIEIGHLAGRTE